MESVVTLYCQFWRVYRHWESCSSRGNIKTFNTWHRPNWGKSTSLCFYCFGGLLTPQNTKIQFLHCLFKYLKSSMSVLKPMSLTFKWMITSNFRKNRTPNSAIFVGDTRRRWSWYCAKNFWNFSQHLAKNYLQKNTSAIILFTLTLFGQKFRRSWERIHTSQNFWIS